MSAEELEIKMMKEMDEQMEREKRERERKEMEEQGESGLSIGVEKKLEKMLTEEERASR